jgi:hypothetical protein
MWLDGYEHVTWPHSGGFRAQRAPRAVVFHTTEGTLAEHAFGVYAASPSCPHLTVEPESGRRFQHVPLDLSSYALRNLPGGCETNSTGVIQIEIVGRAAEAWAWSTQRLRWLGEAVLAPILAACPTIPHLVYGGTRMTCVQWDAWIGGLCGHAHAPENDHWDPGDLDMHAVLGYALNTLGDDDMPSASEIAEAVWSRPISLAGTNYPASEVLGFLHAELTRPDLLQARLVAAIDTAIGPEGIDLTGDEIARLAAALIAQIPK